LIISILKIIEIIALAGTCTSLAYYLLSVWSAVKFLQSVKPSGGGDSPSISILKPLKGTDPEMYESFRSHCLQNYPREYEIIFGVSDSDDPAFALVQRLQAEFLRIPIRVVVCKKNLGNNTKVSNLAQMLAEARYDYLIVNDSDIRVPPDYLLSVTGRLTDAGTGLVTCLYRGMASPTLGSRLESLGISTDFCPGVLTAWQLEGGISFGLGSTLALRRADLAAIGGFEAIADYLADDYELGHRIAALGRKIELSETVVETFLPAYSLTEFIAHQLRWARAIHDSRPGGYFGLLFTFGLPWGVLAVLASHGKAWAWALLGLTAIMRGAMAWTVGKRVLNDPQVTHWMWLLPLRDFLAALIWLASFFGHTVSWRGDSFRLESGRLVRVDR